MFALGIALIILSSVSSTLSIVSSFSSDKCSRLSVAGDIAEGVTGIIFGILFLLASR